MIKVLIVDDSAFMRKALSTMLDKDPGIEVVGQARNGEEGLEKIRRLSPDVVTLDIEMPVMDGLTALRHIMMQAPLPVLMVSSLTTEGAESTLKAMELGAVDYIPKQLSKVSLDIIKIEDELRQKVKTVAKRKIRPQRAQPRREAPPARKDLEEHKHKTQKRDIVGIGVSTGGPPAVQRILSDMEPGFPGSIFIAQHMPGAFTAAFAKRLNDCCSLKVKLAEHGERVHSGCVYIAPGGYHLQIKQQGSHLDIQIASEPIQTLYKPSVDILIQSVAQAVGRRGLGVILTGMGNDGLEGVRALKAKNGRALAQSDSSCVVYGMPRSIVEAGLADEVVELEDMSRGIVRNLFL